MRCIEALGVLGAVLFFGLSSPAAVLSSQDLGALPVNTAASATLTFQLPSVSSLPVVQLHYAIDFSLSAWSCNPAARTCTATVSFTPRYPGLRQDAAQVLDGSGNLLATTLLHGIGLAPQGVVLPGTITSFAGTGALGMGGDGGPAASARLSNPQGLAIDPAGNVYVADSLAQSVRKIDSATGVIRTVAAGLNAPTGVAVDGAGNLYIADSQNNRVKRVDGISGLVTTAAGTGTVSTTLGDGNLATWASLNNPTDVAVDPAGNLYIADEFNGRIRRVDAATRVITTIAGGGIPQSGTDGIGNGGPAVNAELSCPYGLAFDNAGSLFIADACSHLVRQVTSGTISVAAGNGSPAYSGDGGIATNASLNKPTGVRIDAAGNLYIADSGNSLVRQVNGLGIISTLAGQVGQFGFNSNGIPATQAQLNSPAAVALDSAGAIYIADQGNSAVRKIVPGPAGLSFPATNSGSISPAQTLSLANIGNQLLEFSAFALSGNFVQQSSGITTDCSLDTEVPPATACAVSVAFAPRSATALSGSLSWLTNSAASGASQTVALSGTGTGSANPDPTVNAASLLFSNQTAGVASAPQVVTLSNPGPATLTLTENLSGLNRGDFSVANVTCQSTLAAGASCTLAVTFTPQAGGPRSATLHLGETAAGPTAFSQTVFLQGMAAWPQLAVTPVVTFGAQPVGLAGAVQTVTVTNASSLDLSIVGISLTGSSDFSIAGYTCHSVVNHNGSCTVTLAFAPTSTGQKQASLEFSDQAGNSPQTVQVQGSGVVPVLQPAWGSSIVNLGEIGLGGSVTTQLAFLNTSLAKYSIQAVTVSGANAAEFSVVNGCGSGVSAASSCMVGVSFVPTAAGTRTASLTIVGNGPAASLTVEMIGTGIGQTTFDGAKSGDVRASGDFDGDGISDYVVWRPSTGVWYVIPSSHPASIIIQAWGTMGDIPVPADYDGDGKTDFAVWRPSTGNWHILTANAILKQAWGTLGDIPVPGDYDGDGKTDFAVWRPSTGTWHILTANAILKQAWGTLGDIPVPGDYDGDGKTDFAVWRPSTGTWHVLMPNSIRTQQWGWPSDIPR